MPEKLRAALRPTQPRVVAGGDSTRSEAVHVFEAHAELDLAVAQYVRIRRATRAVLAQKVPENAAAVLGGEADAMQRDIERIANPPCILKVGGRGAVGVVLLPVRHE